MAPKRLIKLPDVERLSGFKATSIYGLAKTYLMPPPIKLTPRSSAWVEDEVAAVNAARIAGRTDDEIRQLVKQLVAARSEVPPANSAAPSEVQPFVVKHAPLPQIEPKSHLEKKSSRRRSKRNHILPSVK